MDSTDTLTYKWAALTLQVGMYASFGAMSLGLAWWLLAGAPGGEVSASSALPLDRVLPELLSGNPLALLNLGVLLLLATPGVTLLAVVSTYVAARNWRFAGVASVVALILLASIALSMKWIW